MERVKLLNEAALKWLQRRYPDYLELKAVNELCAQIKNLTMDPYWLLGILGHLYGNGKAPAELLDPKNVWWKAPQVFVSINLKRRGNGFKAYCLRVYHDRR